MNISFVMQRVLLKLSGEALGKAGFDAVAINILVAEIAEARKICTTELALLIGGGNIWRGRDAGAFAFDAAYADMIGMGATVLNALVLAGALRNANIPTTVFSSLPFSTDVQLHNISTEKKALAANEVIIFAGGTGCPFFTTDSAAVLRALEIGADAVLKGTKVDGVYDADPHKNPLAQKFSHLTFDEALAQELQIMDATAFALARENNLPIYVFDAFRANGIAEALADKNQTGTWVRT